MQTFFIAIFFVHNYVLIQATKSQRVPTIYVLKSGISGQTGAYYVVRPAGVVAINVREER